jgi:hypothetical protein
MRFVPINSITISIRSALEEKDKFIRQVYMVWDFHCYYEVLMVHYYPWIIIHKQRKMKKQVKEDLIKARNKKY